MNRLLFASTNAGKLQEIAELLKGHFQVVGPSDPLFTQDQKITAPHVLEDGDSYYENALKKATGYQKVYRSPVLCDDSGLEVDALKGAPGIHSAYYGGKNLTWPQRWEVLLHALKDTASRTARFRCVLCYYDGVTVPQFYQGTVEGKILENPQGNSGFGYDPLFYSTELGKSLGEATVPEKASVSHRARAIRSFLRCSLLDRPDTQR